MSNSDSEDFESADEGTVAARDKTSGVNPSSSDKGNKSEAPENSSLCSKFESTPAKNAPEKSCSADLEMNGARPKVYDENSDRGSGKRASRTKHSQGPIKARVSEGVSNEGFAGKPEEEAKKSKGRKEPKKLGAKKLGSKIPSIKISASEQDEICGDNSHPDKGERSQCQTETKETDTSTSKQDEIGEDNSSVGQPEGSHSHNKAKSAESKAKGKQRFDQRDTVTDSVNYDKVEEKSAASLLDKLAGLDVIPEGSVEKKAPSDGWGSWGNWGVSTILSGASSVTSQVTQGLSSVTSAIESGLGALDPVEMARIDAEEKKAMADTHSKTGTSSQDPGEGTSGASAVESSSAPSSSGVMGNVLRFMESTGELIVSSGLNTLETLGKKTMDVLQEGDPGLKKKRALLLGDGDKPVLSQVLKEARIKAAAEEKERAKLKQSRKAHFELLFDDYRGLVHLEALEMLSRTCQMKLQGKLVELSGPSLIEFKRTLAQVKEQCELPDDDDDDEDGDEERGTIDMLERDLSAAMRGLSVPVSYTKLIRISEDTDAWLATMKSGNDDEGTNENEMWEDDDDDDEEEDEEEDPQSGLNEIHEQAIRALARFTAAVTEHFHKTAELLLLKDEHNTSVESHCLVMMTTAVCSRVSSVAARFSELLSATANGCTQGSGAVPIDHNSVNSLITNVFLEASNSSTYIQDASNLLVPVLQVGAVQ